MADRKTIPSRQWLWRNRQARGRHGIQRRASSELALASTRPAGRVVQVGLAGGTANVTALKTVKPQVSVSVWWWGDIRALREVLALAEALWPLDTINDVCERVKHGQVAGRAVLTPWRPRRF